MRPVAGEQEGEVIPGSGGIRKLRWAVKGRGKRGGLRVIYYLHAASTRANLAAHALQQECQGGYPCPRS